MNKTLADQYVEYDNQLNQYFDQVLLDLVTDEFRNQYHQLRQDILDEILKDNKCYQIKGMDYPSYCVSEDYDDVMISLIQHYYTVKNCKDNVRPLYEVELMMVEHYVTLCGYRKDEAGYWYCDAN